MYIWPMVVLFQKSVVEALVLIRFTQQYRLSIPTMFECARMLVNRSFWAKLSSEEKVSWLEFRERVAMQYKDVLFLRELEQSNMEQQDVVEMSRYHWDNLDNEEVRHLKEYQHAWQVLGGGPYVHARLQVTNAPRTPPRDTDSNQFVKRRKLMILAHGLSHVPPQ